jgi:D-proline reductase (dithiol) PrdA
MSITPEAAEIHKNDPAVACCRITEGTVLSAGDLEDPTIFPDLVDSGLLTLDDDTLTIGQVLGGKIDANRRCLDSINQRCS